MESSSADKPVTATTQKVGSVKARPKTDDLVNFLNQATRMAEGKRQNQLMLPVAQQAADLLEFSSKSEKWWENLRIYLEEGVERSHQMAEHGAFSATECHEGQEDAYSRVLAFVKGVTGE